MVSVSSYCDVFREAFSVSCEGMDENCEKIVDKIEDLIWRSVQEKVRENTLNYLEENIKDDICQKAAKVAESMLANAIAGDDTTLRNLFGFSEWYMKNLYVGEYPTQYELIDMLVRRHPEFFQKERERQLLKRIELLTKELKRVRTYYLEKLEEGGFYG